MTISASPGLTAAETKECADKLVNTRSHSSSSTSKVDMKRDIMPRKETSRDLALSPEVSARRFVSLCSPAGAYKEKGLGMGSLLFAMMAT